ncbi:MAG: hypothetical protein J3Q66DRAFT_405010 [Benniella sp.]|nr:MAG: hypothetical protein J3Q66DRAFT_405010 [Benniella sp.]
MPSIHPLQLPEILSDVATYVPEHSLHACSLVSKLWHRVFNPHVWRNIRFHSDRRLLPKDVRCHALLVKTLNIDKTITQEYASLRLPNLVSLELAGSFENVDFTEMFAGLSSLSHLSLDGHVQHPGFWLHVHGLLSLKSLAISGTKIDKKDINIFWSLCTRLERLRLGWESLHNKGIVSFMEFPFLKEIDVSYIREDEVPIVLALTQRCPGLQEISWFSFDTSLDAQFIPAFIQSLGAGTWPALESIAFGAMDSTNEDLTRIMEGMRRITELSMGGGPGLFRSNSMEQLRPHFQHLKLLNLGSAKDVSSQMAQEVLSSCPLLVKLRVPQIDAMDIVQGQSWVCLGLRELSVFFSFDPSTIEFSQTLVMDQLSKLTRLEELNLAWERPSGATVGPMFQESIDLRLENDLGRLWNLRRLRHISFTYTKQKMGEQEINWILEHWRSLELLFGVLNYESPFMERRLKQRLHNHGLIVGPELYSNTTLSFDHHPRRSDTEDEDEEEDEEEDESGTNSSYHKQR